MFLDIHTSKYTKTKRMENLFRNVSNKTLKAISDMELEKMTDIQAKTISKLFVESDVVVSGEVNSGKALAFIIPAIELLNKLKFSEKNGTGVLIISRNQELSMEIYEILKKLLKYHPFTHELILDNKNRQSKAQGLDKGVNILVATPAGLLNYLKNATKGLFRNLKSLVIAEADQILDNGFKEEMQKIIQILPQKRQTLLFSETLTKKTDDLIKIALKKEPVYISLDENEEKATLDGFKLGYVVCTSDKRYLLLSTFLKKNKTKKVMVLFSSCLSVKYHNELFSYIDLPTKCIHGKQSKKSTTFSDFCKAKSGILLCTDVAARGLETPKVDWIVQYDPPSNPKEYIQRVGRMAQEENKIGHALLILRPEETGLLKYIKRARIPIQEYDFSPSKITNGQNKVEKLIKQNYFLQMAARDAYRAYVLAYKTQHVKKVYDVTNLDLQAVAKSFGLSVPPFVEI